MTDFATFYDSLSQWGLESFHKYYGLYPCRVERNDDEEARGRIQVSNPIIGEGEIIEVWVLPCLIGAGPDRGSFWPPEVGDWVYCSFTRGEPDRPEIYLGGWYADGELPRDFRYTDGVAGNEFGVPERRGFITRKGHRLVFSDEAGKESIRLLWHKADEDPDRAATPARSGGKHAGILIESDGSVTITNQNGAVLKLDAADASLVLVDDKGNLLSMKDKTMSLISSAGDSVEMNDGAISVNAGKTVTVNAPSVNLAAGGVDIITGADSPAMRFVDWVAWAGAHTHLTAFGPSSPPVVPPTPTIASKNVKLK
jgi:hypothetical protein